MRCLALLPPVSNGNKEVSFRRFQRGIEAVGNKTVRYVVLVTNDASVRKSSSARAELKTILDHFGAYKRILLCRTLRVCRVPIISDSCTHLKFKLLTGHFAR